MRSSSPGSSPGIGTGKKTALQSVNQSSSARMSSVTSQMIPRANRLLGFTARFTWKMLKGLARVAVSIPGWFVRLNRPKRGPGGRVVPMKNNSTDFKG